VKKPSPTCPILSNAACGDGLYANRARARQSTPEQREERHRVIGAMNSVANCTQAIGNETDKSAGAREIDWRHLAHHPDNHGERQNGDERRKENNDRDGDLQER
jgi:hypothetical protein